MGHPLRMDIERAARLNFALLCAYTATLTFSAFALLFELTLGLIHRVPRFRVEERVEICPFPHAPRQNDGPWEHFYSH